MNAEEQLIVNGIDGTSGEYLVPPMTPRHLAAIARGDPIVTVSSTPTRTKPAEMARLRHPRLALRSCMSETDAHSRVNAALHLDRIEYEERIDELQMALLQEVLPPQG